MRGLWDQYWVLVEGNIWAMPLEALITVSASLALVRPLRRLGRRFMAEFEDLKNTALAAHEKAAAAHKIAADTYEHATGRSHPDAPKEGP